MIKEIKTEQFAGIQDKKVQFTDGMNILLGKNEAGKSTLLSILAGIRRPFGREIADPSGG